MTLKYLSPGSNSGSQLAPNEEIAWDVGFRYRVNEFVELLGLRSRISP
jgi:hypothetical protein